MNNSYKEKYLKYKKKYLELKGGSIVETVIFKKDDTYIVTIDDNYFLKFKLYDYNINDITEYINECGISSQKTDMLNFIKDKDNIKLNIVYLSNFYILTSVDHSRLHKQLLDDSNNKTLIEGTNITTDDIKGLAGKILLFALKCIYGNKILLCLEPVLGDSPQAKNFMNYSESDNNRYTKLIGYYKNHIYKTHPQNIKVFTTLEQYHSLKHVGIFDSSMVTSYSRDFLFGVVDLTILERDIVLEPSFNSMNFVKWGFGIENEVGLYSKIEDNKIYTVDNNKTTNKYYSISSSVLRRHIESLRDINIKKHTQKMLDNLTAFLEGNSDNDLMLESTTILPINNNIESYITEIKKEREFNLISLNNMSGLFGLPKLNNYNCEPYEAIKKGISRETYNYLGSYHFNITLPHIEKINTDPSQDFINRHVIYARLLQWFEPLLLAVYGQADTRSMIDKKKYSQASYRLFNSATMFINTDELISTISVRREIHEDNTVLIDKKNKYLDLIKGELEYKPLVDKTIRGYDLRTAAGEVGKEFKGKYFGFEFRLMDYFPIENLKQFCEIMWLLAFILDISTQPNFDFITNAAYNPIVMNQIKNIVATGWNAAIDHDYLENMRCILQKLGIPLSQTYENVYDLLNSIYNLLIIKYNNCNFNTLNVTQKSYKTIINTISCNNLDCPNKQSKNNIIKMYINKILKSDKKFDNVTERHANCRSVTDRLNELCGIYLSFPEINDGNKQEIKNLIHTNSILSDCFINYAIDDIDIDNFYYYFKYIRDENKCEFN